ncbi:MAG: ATP-binding protein [Deltaproteobacteria bacterium]|nr:MAG: ATP-binding protein [Deltaproteobacteria bacterium]
MAKQNQTFVLKPRPSDVETEESEPTTSSTNKTVGCHLCEWKGYQTYPKGSAADAKKCSCQDEICPMCEGVGGFEVILDSGNRAWKTCQCQTLERRMELYRSAGIPARFSTKTLDAFAPNDKSQMMVRTHLYKMFQADESGRPKFQPGQRGLLLMGSPGTGKTHLMVGLLRYLTLELGIPCRFQDFGLLLSRLRSNYSSEGSEMSILQPLIDVEVLLIDDLGKGRNSKWELGIIDILVSCRYNADRTTLITTNYTEQPENTLRERFRGRGSTEGEEVMQRDTLRERVGDRIYSRLQEMCRFFLVRGIDYRQKLSQK